MAWNPLGQRASPWLRLPVSGALWRVSALGKAEGFGGKAEAEAVPCEAVPIDARTKSLPLLYLNRAGLSAAAAAEREAGLRNKARHWRARRLHRALPRVPRRNVVQGGIGAFR